MLKGVLHICGMYTGRQKNYLVNILRLKETLINLDSEMRTKLPRPRLYLLSRSTSCILQSLLTPFIYDRVSEANSDEKAR